MSVLFEKNLKTQKFCKKNIQQIKDLPADSINSLIDKVEIVGDVRKLNKLSIWIRLVCTINLAMIAALMLYVYFGFTDPQCTERLIQNQKSTRALKSIDAELDKWVMTNQEWLFDYFDEPRPFGGFSGLNSTQIESYKEKIRAIMKEMMVSDQLNTDRSIDLEAKTANFVSDILLKLKKKDILKGLGLFVVILICARLYFGNLFYRNQEMNVFKNVCKILEIENETYFCKRGYYWSIDEAISSLKLSKIYIKVGKGKKTGVRNKLTINEPDKRFLPSHIKAEAKENKAKAHQQLFHPGNPGGPNLQQYMYYMPHGQYMGQMNPQYPVMGPSPFIVMPNQNILPNQMHASGVDPNKKGQEPQERPCGDNILGLNQQIVINSNNQNLYPFQQNMYQVYAPQFNPGQEVPAAEEEEATETFKDSDSEIEEDEQKVPSKHKSLAKSKKKRSISKTNRSKP